jgi:hypothetical protein
LGGNAGALRYYREYFRRTPNAADKPDIENSIRQLELALSQNGLQQMSIFSAPDGAMLSIDGPDDCSDALDRRELAGKHRLTLTHPGYFEGYGGILGRRRCRCDGHWRRASLLRCHRWPLSK